MGQAFVSQSQNDNLGFHGLYEGHFRELVNDRGLVYSLLNGKKYNECIRAWESFVVKWDLDKLPGALSDSVDWVIYGSISEAYFLAGFNFGTDPSHMRMFRMAAEHHKVCIKKFKEKCNKTTSNDYYFTALAYYMAGNLTEAVTYFNIAEKIYSEEMATQPDQPRLLPRKFDEHDDIMNRIFQQFLNLMNHVAGIFPFYHNLEETLRVPDESILEMIIAYVPKA